MKGSSYLFLLFLKVSLAFSAFGQIELITTNRLLQKLEISSIKYPFLIIALPTSDCYKCRAPLSNILDEFKNSKIGLDSSRSFLVTDNYVFAKDFLEEHESSIKIKVQKNINEKFCPEGKSILYLFVSKDSSYQVSLESLSFKDIDRLKYPFSNNKSPSSKTFLFKDSIFNKNSFQIIFSNGNIAFFDPILQRGAFTKTDSTLSYIRPSLSNYEEIKTFFSKIDTQGYVIVNKEKAVQFVKATKLPIIHINSILSYNDSVYCFFTVNRYLTKPNNDSDIIISPHNYLAIKEAKNKNQFLSIFDISSYQKYVLFETLDYGGKEYFPIQLSPMYMTEKITADGYWIRIQKVESQKDENPPLVFIKTDPLPRVIKIDSSLSLEDRFTIFRSPQGDNVICKINKINTPEVFVKKTSTHLLLNSNTFTYLYDSYMKNNILKLIYRNLSGTINVADVDVQQIKMLSSREISNLFNKSVEQIFWLKNHILAVGKEMTNEDYNIGIISVSLIPKSLVD